MRARVPFCCANAPLEQEDDILNVFAQRATAVYLAYDVSIQPSTYYVLYYVLGQVHSMHPASTSITSDVPCQVHGRPSTYHDPQSKDHVLGVFAHRATAATL